MVCSVRAKVVALLEDSLSLDLGWSECNMQHFADFACSTRRSAKRKAHMRLSNQLLLLRFGLACKRNCVHICEMLSREGKVSETKSETTRELGVCVLRLLRSKALEALKLH